MFYYGPTVDLTYSEDNVNSAYSAYCALHVVPHNCSIGPGGIKPSFPKKLKPHKISQAVGPNAYG